MATSNNASAALVSADSHIVEPPTLWVERIGRRFGDQTPHVIRDAEGDKFVVPGAKPSGFGVLGSAGRVMTKRTSLFEEMRAGGWDPQQRILDMDEDGVRAEVLYPSLAMTLFNYHDEPEYQAACFSAYNDWLSDYCAMSRNRLIGLALVSLGDVQAGIKELQRVARVGFKGVVIAGALPATEHYGQAKYSLFWAEAERLGVPVSLHSFTGATTSPDIPLVDYGLTYTHVKRSITQMLFGCVFQSFPGLRVISVENDAGWVAHLMERLDWTHEHKGVRLGKPLKTLPSEQLRQHVRYTFIRDQAAIITRKLVGVENLMWSSDYPHDDSTWPESQRVVREQFNGVEPDDVRKMTFSNAARLYQISGVI